MTQCWLLVNILLGVFLAPRYVTGIRMSEPINSVVVGDPASFSAEHSDREPSLVLVKPITTKAAQTNLRVLTTRGLHAGVLLVSRAESELHIEDEGRPPLLSPDAFSSIS
jgi:hypothetical protein